MTIVRFKFENTDRRDIYDNLGDSNNLRQHITHFINLKRLYKSEVSTIDSNQTLNLSIYADTDGYCNFFTRVNVYDKQHLQVNGGVSLNTIVFHPVVHQDEPILELDLRIDTDGESEGVGGEYIGNVITEGMKQLRNVQLEQVIYFYHHFETFINRLADHGIGLNNYLTDIRALAENEGLTHLQAFNHMLSVDVFNKPLFTFDTTGNQDKSTFHAYFTSYAPETTIKKNVFQALTKRKRNQSIESVLNTYVKVKRSRTAIPVHVERMSVPIRDEQTIETIKQSIYKGGAHLTRTNKFLCELLNRVSKSKVSKDATILHTSAQLLDVDGPLSLEGTFLTLTEENTKRMVSFYKSGMQAKKKGGFMYFNWSIFHSFVTNDNFMNVEVDKMSLPFITVLNKHCNGPLSESIEQLQSNKSAVISQLTRPSEEYEQSGCLLLTNEFEQNVYWNGLPTLTKDSSIGHLYVASDFKALIDLNYLEPKLQYV